MKRPVYKICSACARPIYRCVVCTREFAPMRYDADTCSLSCRQKRFYRNKMGLDIQTGKKLAS